MAELFEIFNNPWEDSTSPREQTSTTEDPTPDVKKPEEEQLVLVEGGACEVSKEENDPADGKSTPETTNAISEGLVCEQRRKDSQTKLDKPQQENSTTEASTVVQTTELDKSTEQDNKFSGKSEILKGISAAVQAMELEEESGRLEEGEEENDVGNTYINRLKYENDKLQIENQNLTEKILRETEELHNLRKELEVVQEQLQQALSNQRSVSLSKSILTKPIFGVPTPLNSHLASIPPTPFSSYVGTQPLPFGASITKITTSPSEFEAALKAPFSNGVSSSKKLDNSFTAIKDSLSENRTTTPATPLLSFTPVTTGDSPFGGKKPAASVASSTGATNGSVASGRSGRTSPAPAFRDKPATAKFTPEPVTSESPMSGISETFTPQNICFMAQYRHKSQEELRLEDYSQGWRFSKEVRLVEEEPEYFQATTLVEPIWVSGMRVRFQNLCFMRAYKGKSMEELRLDHYARGWRFERIHQGGE